MKLEWDSKKASFNLQKHGVSFEDAVLVFGDSGRIEYYDDRENYGEDRWITIGFSYTMLITVAYTVRESETIRIISARKADTYEQKQYRKANY